MMQQIQEAILLESVQPNLGTALTNLRKLCHELWADLTFRSILSFLPFLYCLNFVNSLFYVITFYLITFKL